MNVTSTNLLTGTELTLKPGHGMTREQELYDCMNMCWDMLKSLKKDLDREYRMNVAKKYGMAEQENEKGQ